MYLASIPAMLAQAAETAKPDMGFAALVTIAGISIVFLVLIALVLIFTVFGKVMNTGGKKKAPAEKKAAPAKAAPAKAAPAPAAPVNAGGVPGEIVAAISAALAALGEGGTVRSIRPVMKKSAGRSAWSFAGISSNTKPF